MVDELAEQSAAHGQTHLQGVRHRDERAGQRGRRKRRSRASKWTRCRRPSRSWRRRRPRTTAPRRSRATRAKTPKWWCTSSKAPRKSRARKRPPPAGKWSTSGAALSKELPTGKHTFTAKAIEKSGLGNANGESGTVSFEVDTEVPSLTITGAGGALERHDPVVLGHHDRRRGSRRAHPRRLHGSRLGESDRLGRGMVDDASAKRCRPANTRSRRSRPRTAASATGKGRAKKCAFEVDTTPPDRDDRRPGSPTGDTTPPFSGDASENTEVVVHVFEGATEVASAKTTASGGKWSTSTLSKALPSGKHSFTATATEKSGIGNADGKSGAVSFEVDTQPPTVTIVEGPPAPSNDTTPSFSGTASEDERSGRARVRRRDRSG